LTKREELERIENKWKVRKEERMSKSKKRIRVGIFSLEAATVLLLVAAGVGLLHHNLPVSGYCTFVAILFILFGIEMIYTVISRWL